MIYPIANKTLRRDCIKQGKCPECGSELDTGFECNNQACQFDAAPEVAELATIILLVSERADPNLILTRLRSFVAAEKEAYEKAMADLRTAVARESREIEQTLGKALGYPWYKDDPKNFPNATEANGVCVGEHVPASLAVEAARKIADLTRERDEALSQLNSSGNVIYQWREVAERAEADAAAMRQLVRNSFRAGRCSVEFHDKIMSFTAGRDLLARMGKLEAVMAAATKWRAYRATMDDDYSVALIRTVDAVIADKEPTP